MAADQFRGTGAALVTPFQENRGIDFTGLEKLLTYTEKLDYWVVNGTTGESPTVTASERAAVLDFVAGHNPLQRPIMYGIGGNSTQQVVDQVKKVDQSLIQGILSVCPYYNKPTQKGLWLHYTEIADHSPLPVFLYNVPGRTACNIEAETTLKLAEHPNIAGIKEALNDPHQIRMVAENRPQEFLLLSGDDINTVPLMKSGGDGVISVMANAFPFHMKQMVDHCLKAEWEEAEEILNQLLPINPLMYQESNPVGVKKALEYLGICHPYVRLPLTEASAELGSAISKVMGSLMAEKKSGC